VERLGEIARAIGGKLIAGESRLPTGHSIDSRTLEGGDLFFAIVGPRNDGHQYVREAMVRGAAGAVVSDRSSLPPGMPGILVEDTTRALQELAIARRRRIGPKVVGITGSSGKTTTKEMLRQVLTGTFQVMASPGNLNNLYGLPLSLLRLKEGDQVAVVELGISTHGEMGRLSEIADPDVSVLINLHGAHLASFASVDDYASAKAELFRNMRAGTTGLFNGDDERCRAIADSFEGYAATFGMSSRADFVGSGYRGDGLGGSAFELRHGDREISVRLRFGGRHHTMNALAALGTGFMLGCDLDEMVGRLGELEPVAMRGRVFRLKGGVLLLDDSYNANPAAMRAALSVLAEADPAGGRRIAVIGDMLELGPEADSMHEEVGRVLASSGLDAAFLIGPLSRGTAEGAREAGFEELRIFESADEAISAVIDAVRPGDILLVKASRGIGLDRVVSALVMKFGEETADGGSG
jgi:UDP-N-acetylmuramoyl-tripeptide--D-alanyl-D-alanine ligase